jgi:hypothetical protein
MDLRRRILQLVKTVAAVILPAIMRIVSFIASLTSISMMSPWIGVQLAIDKMNKQALEKAKKDGLPPEQEKSFHYLVTTLTVLTIILVWTILAFLIVWIVQHIF